MYKRGISKRLIGMYTVFILMSIFGIISLMSGLVLWINSEGGGYRGDGPFGRNYDSTVAELRDIMFASQRRFWRDVHIYSSLTCVMLVVVHMVLNWKWVVSVTRMMF